MKNIVLDFTVQFNIEHDFLQIHLKPVKFITNNSVKKVAPSFKEFMIIDWKKG